MNEPVKILVTVLPYIEMYGGDTVPWEITLLKENGEKYHMDMASRFNASLAISPINSVSGLGGSSIVQKPILKKTARITEAMDGSATAIFVFETQDTLQLRGKFIYQIDINYGEDLRTGQGQLYIKQNINR